MAMRRARPLMTVIRRRLVLVAALFALVSGLSFLGSRHWAFDLLSHFRVQFAALALILCLLMIFTRQRAVAALLGLLAGIHGAEPAAYMLRQADIEAQAAAEPEAPLTLTLAYHNLRNSDARLDELFAYLDEVKPDVLVLTEMDYARRADLFHGLRPRFRHWVVNPGPSIFNVGVFSRHPRFELKQVMTGSDWPMLHVRICPDETRGCLRVVALHAIPPVGYRTKLRDAALLEAAARAREGEEPAVLVGDLNCTPWSPVFTEVLAEGRLRDRNRAGLVGTWMSRSPLFGLPIDHILLGPGVEEEARSVGPAFGSDHFLLTARLKFAAPRLAPAPPAP